jgi:2-oxo-4-hydroxy-4-carboxy-5-ureidoimidazoline decarboxylase
VNSSADETRAIATFDALPAHEAAPLLESCCGSTAWVNAMVERRPFRTLRRLTEAADEVWWSLGPDDWREAFDHHPRIGERTAAATRSAQAEQWSVSEQNAASNAGPDVQDALARGNEEYERRFGHIYLVFAWSKTAEELLSTLRARLTNDPATELRVAAGEQAKITRFRLMKMFETSQPTSHA